MLRRVLLPIAIVFGLVTSAAAEKRIALVVGNAAYIHVPRLDNPTNDARLMAETLRSLGFTLVGGGAQVDLDKARFDQAVQDFGNQLLGADVALFYYAGHGIQVRGANYLVPLGANPSREADVDFQMLDTNLVLRQMESSGVKLNIVILDACRNNPFGGRGLRATDSGLAQMRAPEGTLISFATQPGNVAQDGVGNSPYTKALAQMIKKPGLDVFSVFNEVGLEVMQSTGNSQQPWVSASPIKGRFYFAAPPPPVAAAPAITADEVFWLAIKDSKLEALFDEFMSKFPGSPRAPEARARLAELKKSQVAVATPPVTPPAPPPVAAPPPAPSSDEVLWSVIKDSSVVASFEEFRRRFPTSPHAAEALARIEQLKKSQVAVVAPPVPPAVPPAAAPKPAVGIFNESGSAQPLSAERERSLKPKDSFRECDVCPEMVVVPAGAFTMGSPTTEPSRDRSESPEHRVTLARPFAVGKFAITFDEWDACVADAGCNGYRPPDEGWGRGRHPVLRVSWNDAKTYLRWLSRKTGKAYRLLSEAEREYVTRAGTTTTFWWGDFISPDQANYNGTYSYDNGPKGDYRRRTVTVQSFAPNPWGLHQVHGNLWDWVEDCFQDSYDGAPTDGSARTAGPCTARVIRGGSWVNSPKYLRAAARVSYPADTRDRDMGFRVARSLQQ